MTSHASRRQLRILIGSLLVLCLAQAAALAWLLGRQPACLLQGIAVRITDGDTFTLDLGGKSRTIRLSEIDAPERDQPYGAQARQLLSDWISGKAVQVRDEGPDKYGRTLGHVYVKKHGWWHWTSIDINAQLVQQGAAWVYRQYASDPTLPFLEAEAQTAKRGLWSLPADQQIPPWVFRHSPVAMLSEAQRNAGCQANKRFCRDMVSCEEARFYLTTCGLHKLDRDGNGIPCESLCH